MYTLHSSGNCVVERQHYSPCQWRRIDSDLQRRSMVADGRGRIRAMMNDDCRADERGSEPPRGCQVQVQPGAGEPHAHARPATTAASERVHITLSLVYGKSCHPARPPVHLQILSCRDLCFGRYQFGSDDDESSCNALARAEPTYMAVLTPHLTPAASAYLISSAFLPASETSCLLPAAPSFENLKF
jgi:hypothetical protein